MVKSKSSKSTLVTKSTGSSEEKRLATFVVLEPQDADGTTTDLHLDWYSAEDIEEGCHSFNRYCRKANLMHMVDTDGYEFIESYITKADMQVEDTFIKKGSWVATIKVSEDEKHDWIWEGIKDGTFDGLSIQCMADVYKIEE
jgi:Putative phage serine protease XkdF